MRISTELLRQRVDALDALDGVDTDALTGDAAAAWAGATAQARHALDTILAGLAQRIDAVSSADAGRFARSKGFSGASGLLSQVGELSPSDAGKLVALGNALADASVGVGAGGGAGSLGPDGTGGPALDGGASPTPHLPLEPRPRFPYLARAVHEGWLGTEKASIVRRTLEDLTIDPAEIEESLVDRARHRALAAVRRMCAEELARVDVAALEAREARNRKARYLSFVDEPGGMVGIHGRLDAASAAPVRAWIDTQVRAQMITEREVPDGERREAGQIAADALTTMARHCLGCEAPGLGVKTTIFVRVDKEALEAGVGLAQCDSVEGPISLSALRLMAVDAEILPAVMGGCSLPLDLGRAKRLFSPAQRIAIANRDGGCAKCGAPVARCDVHHIRWWSQGGRTDISNGVLLCVGCHHRLHDYGWGIEIDRGGRVWFIPPASVDPHRRRQPASPNRHAA